MSVIAKRVIESIPDIYDCHLVPDGARVPAGTPLWVVSYTGKACWYPTGVSTVAYGGDDMLYLTVEPIGDEE